MSIRKPVIRKPKIPKIRKPLISKRKRPSKKTNLSIEKIPTRKKHTTIKKTTKTTLGTCYLENNCKGVISRKITKSSCRLEGGKSWRKTGGQCEKL